MNGLLEAKNFVRCFQASPEVIGLHTFGSTVERAASEASFQESESETETTSSDTSSQEQAKRPRFRRFYKLPTELQHKVILEDVPPHELQAEMWMFHFVLLRLPLHYPGQGYYHNLGADPAIVVRSDPPEFADNPWYAVDRTTRAFAIARFGLPRPDTFPFDPLRDSLVLPLDLHLTRVNMIVRRDGNHHLLRTDPTTRRITCTPGLAAKFNPGLYMGHGIPDDQIAIQRRAEQWRADMPRVPFSVAERIRLVKLTLTNQRREATHIFGGMSSMTSLYGSVLNVLRRNLPNIQELRVELFRPDDCAYTRPGCIVHGRPAQGEPWRRVYDADRFVEIGRAHV